MALIATISPKPIVKATVRPDGTGRLIGIAPITLKNQTGTLGIQYLTELKDVNVSQLASSSTLLYNTTTEKYDIRKLLDTDLPNIDLGLF
jgi:hypothetical protein